MIVTVAICTWNRAGLLDQTLAQMCHLRTPPSVEWELLVVNNDCTDETDAVIERRSQSLPIRRLFEPQSGLSHARNQAIQECKGDLIIWTDDDVLVPPQWLEEYVTAADEHAEATFFGGPVLPNFESQPPSWIQNNLDLCAGPLSICQTHLSATRPIAVDECPFGANMAFRRSRIQEMRFDASLGRVGNNLISGEEFHFIDRLKARGDSGIWVAGATLLHHVPARRLRRDYLWRWWYGGGMTAIRYRGAPPGPNVFGIPNWIIRNRLKGVLGRLCFAIRPGRKWLRSYYLAASAAGMIAELKNQKRNRRRGQTAVA